MERKALIFLRPFTIKNPTRDQQNEFMIQENVTEVECADLGTIYSNKDLYGKDIEEYIRDKIKESRPEWVIAEGKCATALLKMKHQKKILLNPKVSTDDLNNVPEIAIRQTYGFFDERHEQDYERFQSVYKNAAWFPQDDNLMLFTIKEIVQEIIDTE